MRYLDKRVLISIMTAFFIVGATYAWKGLGYSLTLGLLACLAFIQNAAFTLVSRSRNSADPDFHRKCA